MFPGVTITDFGVRNGTGFPLAIRSQPTIRISCCPVCNSGQLLAPHCESPSLTISFTEMIKAMCNLIIPGL